MQTQAQNGTNGDNGNGNGVFDGMTLKDAVKILLEEIANLRKELKDDIHALDRKLSGRMDRLEAEMREMKKELNGKIDGLRMEVHQNQITFMKGHEDLERRVGVLEGTVEVTP